ncbi:Structural maintenance of chromosomes protein 3 [Cryptosporidium hominis]|uniref:Structural maintenance of chromosomes protein n=2 Tax=Cryptosporidium hominis TaxID=237895 RepID=A0ABX5BD59_CRYHO|nr:Structural maintenance of chromosomes protein 3 [Cryptosporidium hominis]|eukprot:PPS94772.1 Structural maintenance of chromosomes protein 3 [Cryptosporidium hominis]
MYIKELKICGFKTYRDETTISFHPGCNCIVGLNGSGKSNILAAIQFLLSDSFGNTLVERRALLHEGLGPQATEAYVELSLDNIGRRLSMYDEDVVTIKRIFRSSSQKNEWQVMGKNISKKDFDSILESCGISRNNPYFIVRQGKVAELATMSDASRLRLLKEIAGTRTYDERRDESIKLLLETETRKIKVDSVFDDIQKRIEVLKDEQKEFKAFLNLDRRRRTLEFLLNEYEWEEASKGEQEYFEKLSTSRERLSSVERNLNLISSNIQSLIESQKNLDIQLEELEHKKKEIQNKISHYSASINDLNFEQDTHENHQRILYLSNLENETKNKILGIENSIKDEKELMYKYKIKYNSILKEKDMLSQQESSLISKNNEMEFSTISEKRSAINRKIELHNIEKEKLSSHLCSIKKSLAEKQEELKVLDSNILKWKEDQFKSQKNFDSIIEKIRVNIEEQQMALEKKHEINKSLYEKENQQSIISNRILELENYIGSRARHSVKMGLNLAREYCEKNNLSWGGLDNDEGINETLVFGTVLEVINVDDIYTTAVEVAAGNNIHNLIVKDKEIATKIVSHIKALNGHRNDIKYGKNYSIVLSPINDIKQLNKSYFKYDIGSEKNAISMIDIIQFDERVRPVIEQIFGNYVIVESLDNAKYLVDKYNVNCITLDGDEWDNKGCVRGGYRNINLPGAQQNSIIICSRQLKNLIHENSILRSEIYNIKSKIKEIEDRVLELGHDREEYLSTRERFISQISKSKEMIHLSESKKRNIQSVIIKVKEEEEKAVRSTDTVQNYIVALKSELSCESLSNGLTLDEENLLKEIISKIRTLEYYEIPKVEREISDLCNDIDKHEVHLNTLFEELYRIQEEKQEEDNMKLNCDNFETNGLLMEYNKLLEESKEFFNEIVNKVESTKKKSIEIEELKRSRMHEESLALNSRNELISLVSSLQKKYDKFRQAKEIALHERTKYSDSQNVISEINIPKEKSKVYQELQIVQKKLSEDYRSINRKVISELDQFIQEYTDLSDRHKELNSAMSSIQLLIETLDIQKEKTLLKTFEEINFYFNQVFRELIPNGDAKLILRLSNDARSIADENDDNTNKKPSYKKNNSIDNKYLNNTMAKESDSTLLGIGIRVTFHVGSNSQINSTNTQKKANGQAGNYYSLNQLSGGQKTLVALAFLFALHRADPAPMYLLDEVDAALDDQYRWSVANLIKKQSISTQFIVTTFRPQILQIADKYFQVSQVNRSSYVSEISKQQALELQQEQYQQKKSHELISDD